MIAFAASSNVNLKTPILPRSSLCGIRVHSPISVQDAAMSMSLEPSESRTELSPAMPFLLKPANLDPEMSGYAGFDPLNFSSYMDVKWLQESEIKHGRICMLAFVGMLVQEFVHLPNEMYSNPLATEAFKQVPAAGLWQILALCGLIEFVTNKGKLNSMEMFQDPERKPGHLGFNPLGLKIDNNVQTQEIKNGRLAMVGVGGVLHSMFLYKTPIIAQLLDFKPMTIPNL